MTADQHDRAGATKETEAEMNATTDAKELAAALEKEAETWQGSRDFDYLVAMLRDAADSLRAAEARVEALEQWRLHWMQLAVALTEALREIEAYPVGDDGFQDIARAALSAALPVPETQP